MPSGTHINIDFDKIYSSKTSGKFKILKEVEPGIVYAKGKAIKRRRVLIKFLDTGTEKIVYLLMAINGIVVDEYKITVPPVGYLGDVSHMKYNKNEYDLWYRMIKKCYDPSSYSYEFYGAKGVTVDKKWHCFANFLRDLPYIENYYEFYNSSINNIKYHLDKDLKQSNIPINQRVYSKDTCIFLKDSDNSRLAMKTKKANGATSQYYGVYATSTGSYQASINVDSKKYFLGTFSDEIAAANVYNFVAARCNSMPILNESIPYMDINEALQYRTSNKPIKFPPNIRLDGININSKNSSQYVGVIKSGENSYHASYTYNGTNINIGTFSNEIAAANAHNWFSNWYGCGAASSINTDIPVMTPSEFLKYKTVKRGSIIPTNPIIHHQINDYHPKTNILDLIR